MADRIRVWPATEDIRKHLRHSSGVRFPETLAESVEWPNDTFTYRRIQDGDVLTEAPAASRPAPAHHEEKKAPPKTT